LRELAAGRDSNEEHLNLALNGAVCSEYEEVKREREVINEEIEIPPEEEEEERKESPEDLDRRAKYFKNLDFRFPLADYKVRERREALIELYHMGFWQFSINMLVLHRTDDNVAAACDFLLDEMMLVEMFGTRYREME
jgi:hypothetical protein